MARVTVTGGAKYKAAIDAIARLKIAAAAGIPAGAKTTDGKSIPEYAVYNELGTSRIPARPFMRNTMNLHKEEWLQIVSGKLNFEEIKKDQAENVMGLVSEVMKAHIQQTIQKGSFAPNAPRTVAAKRASGKVEPDHPLIDTGQMIASIISEVKH